MSTVNAGAKKEFRICSFVYCVTYEYPQIQLPKRHSSGWEQVARYLVSLSLRSPRLSLFFLPFLSVGTDKSNDFDHFAK